MATQTALLDATNPAIRDESIAQAAEAIRKGLLVAFPTETVYGLGADIHNEDAVKSIFAAKERPQDNPLIVHVSSSRQALELMQNTPKLFDVLTRAFWPGPLTLVVPRNAGVLDVVTCGLDTVGVRMPANDVAQDLIRAAGSPLAAPSANRSGKPSPTTARHVLDDLEGRIACVLDGGPCSVGVESTVLDITVFPPVLLRPGGVALEEIEAACGTRVLLNGKSGKTPKSPGTKYRHYRPQAKVVLVEVGPNQKEVICRLIEQYQSKGLKAVLLAPASYKSFGVPIYELHGRDAVKFAQRLYAGLRELDSVRPDVIICAGVSDKGIGMAVMNRLRYAATDIVQGVL